MVESPSLTLEAVVVAVLLLLVQGTYSREEHIQQQADLQEHSPSVSGEVRAFGTGQQEDRRPQHCSAIPAAQGELSVLIWEISPRFRLCEGVWAGYIRTFAPTPHWWLSKQSWARGSKPLGMNSPTCCVGLSSRQLRMSPLQHVSRPLLSTSLSSPAGSKTLGFSTTSSPNFSSLTPG